MNTFIKSILRVIPGLNFLYNPPLKFYHVMYTVLFGVPTITIIGHYQRRKYMRELARKQQIKEQQVGDTVSSFTANQSFQSLVSGEEFSFDSLSEEFVIVVKSNNKSEAVVNGLNNKLSNYNHKVVCLVKEDYSLQQ
jgi:hypothetical protein